MKKIILLSIISLLFIISFGCNIDSLGCNTDNDDPKPEQPNNTPQPRVSFFITSEGSVIPGQFLPSTSRSTANGARTDFSGGNLGGLAGADAHCTRLARAANLTGTWRAFLHTEQESAFNRIGTGPWYNIRREKIADNVAGLKAQKSTRAFLHRLIDEKGLTVSYHDILIGGDPDTGEQNRTQANTCNNWTSDDNSLKGVATGHASLFDVSDTDNFWLTGGNHSGAGKCSPDGILNEGGLGKFYYFAL